MSSTQTNRMLSGGVTLLLGILLSFLLIGSPAAKAVTGHKALILNSSVSGGASSSEATNAIGNGFTVDVVDDATWGAMTAAQFADYQLIVVGDPTCGVLPPVVSQNATALADAVMARGGGNTEVGRRILIGTDPQFHFGQGGNRLIETGIDFAGAIDGASNLYLDFTCRDVDFDANGVPDGQDKLLPLLTIDPTATWTQNQTPPCGGDVSLISNAAQFATLTSSELRGWGCSVHETFPTFPIDWLALAIATDTSTAPTCGTDVDTGAARCGEAYILIAGKGITGEAPNLDLDPVDGGTNPVGTSHKVTATVTNTDGSPRSGVVVSFLVTGANAGATGICVPADCTSNSAGQVTFTYTGTSEGDDTINATITIDSSRQTATASKTWEAGPANTPPDCSAVKADPKVLWPPNHKYRLVTLSGATDPDGDPVTLTITRVTQDEPLNGPGDGDTSPDAKAGSVSNKVFVRSERSGSSDGRVSRIAFEGSDGKGGTCTGSATVGVPHDQGKGKTPVDSGLTVNSFGP
jgi:hypothetical protein